MKTMTPTPAPLVFLDTETTGVHPGRQVWEIGMIRRDEHGQRETQFFLDVDLSLADPYGLGVGRFYERHPHGKMLVSGRQDPQQRYTAIGMDVMRSPMMGAQYDRWTAARIVAHWTHNAHVVASVPSFDTVSLDALVRQCELIPTWHYHLVDVENLAVGYLAASYRHLRDQLGEPLAGRIRRAIQPPWSSDELADLLDVPPISETDRHTALGDTRWAMAIYDKVMGR